MHSDPPSLPEGDDPTLTIGPADPPAPTRLEDLVVADPGVTVRGLLGHGGMGLVQRAVQDRMRREVAVKVLLDGGSPEHAQALVREAWVAGALEHPNILPIHDVFVTADGQPTLVMKRVEGRPWKALLADEAAVAPQADDVIAWHLDVLCSVCRAVELAHSRGILHRDIKPANVMVGSFGEVYLLDWGLALSLEPDPTGRFRSIVDETRAQGTPAYMAPEMGPRARYPLQRGTDVFLLGAVLHCVLTGTPPARGRTRREVLGNLDRPIPIDAALPEDLRDLLQRSLAHDPATRPSAEDFRRELERHLSRRALLPLLAASRTRVEELDTMVRGEPDRIALYDLLGEIRFGLREVQRGWPESREAVALDRQARCAVATWECAQGDARAARVVLAELEPPAPLAARLEALERSLQREQERLAKLALDASASTGQRDRFVALGLMAALWIGTPVLLPILGVPRSYERALAVVAAQLLTTTVLGFVYRRSLLATRFNRTFLALLVVHPVFAGLLVLAARHWGLSVDQASVLELVVGTALVSAAALVLDRWFLLSAVTLGLASIVAVVDPSWVRVVSVPCYLGMVANMWILRDRLAEDDQPAGSR